MQIPNIKREKISNQVFTVMKDMILSGQWPINEKIESESSLAQSFNVSKMTVHAALQKLEVLGLVEIRVGVGTYVKANKMSDCIKEISTLVFQSYTQKSNILELRCAIELEAINLAIERQTPEQIEQLKMLYQQMVAANMVLNSDQIIESEFQFHRYICTMTQNELFESFYDMCFSLLEENFESAALVSKKEAPDNKGYQVVNDPHYQLIEAIERKDKPLAIDAYQRMINVLKEYYADEKA